MNLDAMVASGTLSQGAAAEIRDAVDADAMIREDAAKPQTGRPRKPRVKPTPELGGHPLDGE